MKNAKNLPVGFRIATAAAALLAGMTGACGNDDDAASKTQGIQCQAGNSCKGMSECKGEGGKNACQGKNGCAAMGYVTAKDDADCKAKQAAATQAAAKMAMPAKS